MKKIYTLGLKTTLLKQLAIKMGLFLFVITIAIAANSQTNYYLRTDTFTVKAGVKTFVKPDVSSIKSWTTTGDSLGTHPLNFKADNQVFNVQTNGFDGKFFSLTKTWRVSGSGSKVVIGTKDSIVTFTSGNAAKLVATVDVVAKSTFVINQIATDSITFGDLPVGSNVRYGGNTTVSQKVKAGNYANLSFGASGATYYPLTLPTDPISVSGVFTPRASNLYGSTINFNGGGGQVIPAGNYYNLIVSGTKTISDSLKGNIYVAGSFSNQSIGSTLIPFTIAANGTIAASSINYLALSASQTISNELFYNLTFSNGQMFNVSSINYANSTITLAQANPEIAVGQKVSLSFLNVKTNSLTLDTTSSITAITSDTVLTLSKPVMIRLFANPVGHAPGATNIDTLYATSFSTIDSTVTLNATPAFVVSDTLLGVLFNGKVIVTAVNGNVVKVKAALANTYNLGAISLAQANYQPSPKTISGFNYILNTFTPSIGSINTLGSTIDFIGKRQNIPGITYDNLRINQDSSLAATLTGPSLVTGSFTIEKGKLNTSTKNLLTLDANATFPTVTNDTFFVNGPLAKNFASTTPFTYQIGAVIAGVSHPRTVVITPNTADTKTYTSAFTIGKVQNSTKVDSLTVFSIDTASYYTVTGSNYGGADSTAKIAFQYRYDTSNANAGLVLAHYVGTKFKSEGNTLVGTGTLGTITTDNLIGTFGKFAFGFNPKLVPVTFASVGVIATSNGAALITWKSATEINTNKYVVEASTDGINYSVLGTVKAIGAGAYSYTDVTPAAGTNYFRIKAVDNDGKLTYSSVVSLSTNNFTAKVAVYPNPIINKQLNVVLSTNKATYSLTIVNALGQTIASRSINHNGGTVAYTVALPTTTSVGTYFVKLNDGTSQTIQSVMVK